MAIKSLGYAPSVTATVIVSKPGQVDLLLCPVLPNLTPLRAIYTSDHIAIYDHRTRDNAIARG